MFNSGLRKSTLKRLEDAVAQHELVRERVKTQSVELFNVRSYAATHVIDQVENYVNRLANSPKEFDRSVREYRIEVNRFDSVLHELEIETAKAKRYGAAGGLAGVTAGVGVAAVAPSVAMAVATTFGVASTGTAISALSGAAATSAALAWLGGGALAAGGAGMAGGQALLALAGPVGWGIGATAAVGSAVFYNSRNKKIAEKANADCMGIEAQILSLKVANDEIHGLRVRTKSYSDRCLSDLAWLKKNAPVDYALFGTDQKQRLGVLVNNINGVSKLLKKQVSL